MDLQLPKSKIVVCDRFLTKTGKNGAMVSELLLTDITDVHVEKTADYCFSSIIIAVFVAMAVVSKTYSPSVGWGWIGTIVCLGIAGVLALGIHGRKIVVETTNGVVGFLMIDTFEEADGFVLSLKQRLYSQNATVGCPEIAPDSLT